MPASIFNGKYVKLLKDALKFKSGGVMEWDYTNGCPTYETPYTGVVNQIGQEMHIIVYNGTGSQINNGTPVYINGADPDNTHPSVAKGIATSYESSRIIGLATHDIPNGQHGIVTSNGIVRGLNTSAFTAGDTIYLSESVAGELTSTMPTDGAYPVMIGSVSKDDAIDGEICVHLDRADFTAETVRLTGWSNDYGPATLSFDDAQLKLTISPTGSLFHFYENGIKYEKATDSYTITDTEGTWIIYYSNGTLTSLLNPTSSQVASIILTKPFVAIVYWNATDNKNEYVGYELHDCQFPKKVHLYNHKAYGARYISGLGLNTLSVDQTGNLAAHAQFGVDAGEIVDEDISFTTPSIASTTGLNVFYLAGTGVSPTLRSGLNAGYPVLTTGTGRLAYNQLSGGNWLRTEVTNNNYVLCHVFCINENTAAKRIVAFMGQAEYATVTLARTGATTEIINLQQIGVVPREIKSIATLVYQTSDGYSNAVKARIRSITTTENWVDWRTINTTGGTVAGGASVSVFADNAFQIFDNADPTKTMQFEASGLSTGTTRTATMPNRNIVLGNIQAWETSTVYATTATIYYGTTRRIYKCLVAHTSGTWATDLAAGKWGEMAITKQIAPLRWFNSSDVAAIEENDTYGRLRYGFESGLAQKIKTSFVVPHDYVPGTQITLWFKIHCATAGAATVLLTALSTLLRNDTDALSSTTNQNTSSNTALAINTSNLEYYVEANLTDANGAINSVAVNPKDTINIELTRGTDSNADVGYMFPSNSGVLL